MTICFQVDADIVMSAFNIIFGCISSRLSYRLAELSGSEEASLALDSAIEIIWVEATLLLSRWNAIIISKLKSAPTCTALFLLLSTGCAHRYHGQGIVLAIDHATSTATISHRDIPGYMPAMAMPFRLASKVRAEGLAPGSRVRFELRVSGAGARITRIITDAGPPPDFLIPKAENVVAIGSAVPDFSLLDEHGRAAHLADSRGRLTAVEFIYTRCPLPDVCPRLSANFALLQRRFGSRIALLSITLDPDHDTPEVLSEYAHRWNANPATWRFLTGTPDEIRRVAGNFGLVYWAEDGAITHTVSTALIGPDGVLIGKLEGSGYTSRQLTDLVGAKIDRGPQP
ncbi:MAG TPA: SCO family protein [Bryobacteraceae bacterium]|nr:SCO family protein [Bryobacteraceae bacterium]